MTRIVQSELAVTCPDGGTSASNAAFCTAGSAAEVYLDDARHCRRLVCCRVRHVVPLRSSGLSEHASFDDPGLTLS